MAFPLPDVRDGGLVLTANSVTAAFSNGYDSSLSSDSPQSRSCDDSDGEEQAAQPPSNAKLEEVIGQLYLDKRTAQANAYDVKALFEGLPQLTIKEVPYSNVAYNGNELAKRLLLLWLQRSATPPKDNATVDAHSAVALCRGVVEALQNIKHAAVFQQLKKNARSRTDTKVNKQWLTVQVRVAYGAIVLCDDALKDGGRTHEQLLARCATPVYSKAYLNVDDTENEPATAAFQALFYRTFFALARPSASTRKLQSQDFKPSLLKQKPARSRKRLYSSLQQGVEEQVGALLTALDGTTAAGDDVARLSSLLKALSGMQFIERQYYRHVVSNLCELLKRLLVLAMSQQACGASAMGLPALLGHCRAVVMALNERRDAAFGAVQESDVKVVSRLKLAALSGALYRLVSHCDQLIGSQARGCDLLCAPFQTQSKRLDDYLVMAALYTQPFEERVYAAVQALLPVVIDEAAADLGGAAVDGDGCQGITAVGAADAPPWPPSPPFHPSF